MIRLFKRYTLVSILIFVCFSSAFIALFDGLVTTMQGVSMVKQKNQYAYKQEMEITIYLSDDVEINQVLQLAEGIDTCNIRVDNMQIFFEEIDKVYRPHLILVQNEELSVPSAKKINQIPSMCLVGAKSAIHGNSRLSIHGKEIHIYEEMDDNKYPFVSGLFILNAVDYFEIFPEALNDIRVLGISISSNENNVVDAFGSLKENIERKIEKTIIHCKDISREESIFQNAVSSEAITFICLFLFALLNTSIISYYWVVVRKHEISVRKAYGATNLDIIFLMTKELLQIVTVAILFSSIIQMPILTKMVPHLDIYTGAILMVVLLICVFVAVLFSMLIPTRFILHTRPINDIRM